MPSANLRAVTSTAETREFHGHRVRKRPREWRTEYPAVFPVTVTRIEPKAKAA